MNRYSFGKKVTRGLDTNDTNDTNTDPIHFGRVIKRPLPEISHPGSVNVYPASINVPETHRHRNIKSNTNENPTVAPHSNDTLQASDNKSLKPPSDYNLAKIIMENNTIAIIENQVLLGDQSEGYFTALVGSEADTLVRKRIPEGLKKYVSSKNIKEMLQWFKTFDHLRISDSRLETRNFFVNCLNVVVDARDLSTHPKSLGYYFTSVVNSTFPTEYSSRGTTFENTIKRITGGSQEVYMLIQEIFGYILSEIRNLKHIFFFLGPKNCGKSLLINLLVELIGKEFTSNLSLHDFNSQFRLSRMYRKKLNCFGETSEAAITRLDLLKAASGGDYLTGEFKYENCFEFINRAALLFAGNHLPKLKVVDQNDAFTERLLIVPFLHPVNKHEQDVHLLQKLLSEKPYITKWAITGLSRLIRNNYQFTRCEQSDEILASYRRSNNSVRMFVDECCELDPSLRTHTCILEEAYHDYCSRLGELPVEDKFFHDALKSIPGVTSGRFRIDGENRNGYNGIALYEP